MRWSVPTSPKAPAPAVSKRAGRSACSGSSGPLCGRPTNHRRGFRLPPLQLDDRDDAVSLGLVLAESGCFLHYAWVRVVALVARHLSRVNVVGIGADLDVGIGMRAQIVQPRGVDVS